MAMTIDTAINILGMVEAHGVCIEAKDIAVETMRKYQQIQEIVKEWREVGLDYDSCDAMDNIERVIEDGNDD